MSASTQAIKLKFRRNELVIRTAYNLQTRIFFKKKTLDQVDKITDQLDLSKSIPNASFNLILTHEI